MGKIHRAALICSATAVAILAGSGFAAAAPEKKLDPKGRCAVCGMFVAKYQDWVTQLRHADGSLKCFDGVKDMLVYYFVPERYGSYSREDITEIWVKDYYTLQWLDGRTAFYVVGSDVFGPMGKEFIAFSTREAAENFKADHHGHQIVTLHAITSEMVQEMRSGGHKMQMQ